MWIAVGLLFPLAAFVAARAVDDRIRARVLARWLPEASAIAALLWCFIAMAILIAGGNRWPRTTQIAWTGIDKNLTATSPAVTIGGNEQEAAIGWPNGLFDPMLRIQPKGNVLRLTMGKGGAFIRSAASGDFLNGLDIPEEHARIIDDYRFEVLSQTWFLPAFVRPLLPFGYRFRVYAPDKSVVLDVMLPRPVIDRYRFVSLEYLESRSSEEATKNAVFENWARPVLIAVTRRGIRVLERRSVSTATCGSPCTLSLKWRRGSLVMTVGVDAAEEVHVHFQRPWRRVSPIPEATRAGRQIIVTREAQPEDYAFLLPIGGAGSDPRAILRLDDDGGVARFANTGGVPDAMNSGRDGGVVTSETSVRSRDYRFNLATAIDVLHAGVVVWRMFIALAGVIAGIVIFATRSDRRERWLCSGLAAILFALLCFRVALAVRYAAAPEYLDVIAVKGVVLSLVALTAVPSLLLLEARLRHDAVRVAPTRRLARRAALIGAGYFFFIALTTLFQLGVAGAIWPSIPPALGPGWKFALAILAALGFFAVHVAVVIWRAYLTGASKVRARFSYDRFAEATEGFWRSVAEARSGRSIRWYLSVLGATAVLLVSLYAFRFFGHAIYRGLQEVAAPLLLTLLPALLWLSAGAYMRTRDVRANSGRLPSRRLLFWAAVTVLAPAVAIPFFIGDPGSLLATAAVFFPVALVLATSDRGVKAGIAVLVALLFAWGIAFVAYLNWESLYTTVSRFSGTGNVSARLLVFKREAGVQQNILQTSQRLEDTYQHTWQNKAIAHEGSWVGLGYGKAPTRRSLVAQDTLQFDSVFSFFVFSEHGLVGGVSLIAIYALPLLLLLLSRSDLPLPSSLGVVIASAFLGEAWFHAAMNLGIWPFAGRNLPLLSANSGTDVVKWMLLFIVAVATPFWHPSARESSRVDSSIVVTIKRYRRFAAAFAIVGALLLVAIIFAGVVNLRDTRLGEAFTWNPMLDTVQKLAADGKLRLDKSNKIFLDDANIARDDSLLAHQIAAFNQLPLDQQTGESEPSQFLGKIYSVGDAASYERVLRKEASRQLDQPPPRPSLFRLVALPQFADEEGFVAITGPRYRIEANPDFNTRVSFRANETREAIPRIVASEQQTGTYVMQGSTFAIVIPRRFHAPYESRAVLLTPTGGEMTMTSDSNPMLSRGDVLLRLRGRRGWMEHAFIRFEVTPDGLLYLDNHPRGFQLRLRRADKNLYVLPGQRQQLLAGDRIDIAFEIGIEPGFTVSETDPAPIVGPAWVMGRWVAAYDRHSAIPWAPYLATALEREWERLGPSAASQQYRTLTFDLSLQRAAQEFVAERGRVLHDEKLRLFAARRALRGPRVTAAQLRRLTQDAFPPRVALTAITIPNGQVVVMAGWPRMNPGRIGGPCTSSNQWCPPSLWIDSSAPSFVRTRYGDDRNFDRIEMGSSTKPLLAAAALAVHPGLDEQLHVSGPAEVETDVFGIPIAAQSGWRIPHASNAWTGFRDFLALSDNRYQVRLGFLALAEKDGGTVQADSGQSPSEHESMNGRSPWHRYPFFPLAMRFSYRAPDVMQRIDDSPFAREIRAMYAVGVRQGDLAARRCSFWTGSGSDDEIPPVTPQPPASMPAASHVFDPISPEIADLGFDFVVTPRQYVSLLLGGNENRWANVDFAGAFATAVTGNPVIPHILQMNRPVTVPQNRKRFPTIAARLRPGLEGVLTYGTAAFARRNLIPPSIAQMSDVKVYAKTGTLAVSEGSTTTSRLVIAYIRWADEARGTVRKGIVFSLFAQDAQQGNAAQWLAEYIAANQEQIAAYLK